MTEDDINPLNDLLIGHMKQKNTVYSHHLAASFLRVGLFATFAAIFFQLQVLQADGVQPHFFGAKPGALAKAKERIAAGDKDLAKALKNLVAEADAALQETTPTVTAKTKVPPSGDKHDYMSRAPYFWPDPKSKTGLPYLRHDGKVNPESRDEAMNDSPREKILGGAVETLSLAYYFTGDEKYAAKAAKFVRVWFLDPETRMNPNLKYAQAILGVNEGRGTGILEGRNIAVAADAVHLLAGSKSWSAAEQKDLDAWLNTYLDWVLTSAAGKEEHAAKNNHGTWYDVQTARLALCLGRKEVARRIIEEAKQGRVAVQIEPDGRQPLELERTASFNYSHFNLEALCELATLGEHAGVDLWNFKTSDGRSIRRAMEFLLPFIDEPAKPWPFEQIKHKTDTSEFVFVLRTTALAYDEAKFESVVSKIPDARSKRAQLLFVK